MTKAQIKEQLEARETIKKWVKPGDTLYVILRHCSRSGMQRIIQVVKMEETGPVYLGYNVALAVGMKYDRDKEGVKVGGCGMDMGFHLVYELSYALFSNGFDCIGDKCPSNDHFNGMERETHYTALTCPGRQGSPDPCHDACDHIGVPDERHRDGGYAITHRWM